MCPVPDGSTPSNLDAPNEALQNELILDIIFDNLELVNCLPKEYRLVCSTWSRLISKRIQKKNWKERFILELNCNSIVEKFILTFGPSRDVLPFNCFWLTAHINHKLLWRLYQVFRSKFKSLGALYKLKELEDLRDYRDYVHLPRSTYLCLNDEDDDVL